MSETSHLLSKQNSQQPKQFRGGEKKVMKKSLSLLVAIAMVFSMFATLVSAADKTAGEKLQGYGIIKGTNEGLAEDQEWVRQDVTVLLSRLLGVEAKAAATANTHGFTDLDSKFYNGYVSWAKEEGYFNGESATKFGVGNSITNQQFAAVLLRVLKVDVDYAAAFDKAVELKLVSADLDKAANAIRGDIYTSLVTALDYEIDGKKLGTILNLKGYEITNVKVEGATAPNSKTVVVEFNQEVGTVTANNFVVKKDENDSVDVISAVSVSGNKATLTLFDALSNGKSYTVEVSNVTGKDSAVTQEKAEIAAFTYNKAKAAGIELPKTVVAKGDVVKYSIKDAAGNDITPDFNLDEVITVNSSDQNVVQIVSASELKAHAANTGFSVVNVVLTIDEDTTFETGNKVVEVKDSVAVVDAIGKVSFGALNKDAETSIFKDGSGRLQAEVLDSNGKALTVETKFKSSNPTVLVVDEDGTAYPVKAGSATVVVTAKFNDKTVSKSVVITVKAEAKLTGADLDKSTVRLVFDAKDSAKNPIVLPEKVKLTVKDQYGDALKNSAQEVKIRTSKTGVAKVNNIDIPTNNTLVSLGTVNTDGVLELTFESIATDAATAVFTVEVGTIKKTISVATVKQAALAGYTVELSATKIDQNPLSNAADSNALDDKEVTVSVYQKDVNGNKIGVVTSGIKLEDANSTGGAVDVDNVALKITPRPGEVGSEVVNVFVNNVKVGTYTITVVNTAKHLTKVTQSKNAITASANVVEDLFGNNENGGAFVGYDQYGDKIRINSGDYTVFSSNKNIIAVNANVPSLGTTTGTALLTIVVKDTVFTITVKVN